MDFVNFEIPAAEDILISFVKRKIPMSAIGKRDTRKSAAFIVTLVVVNSIRVPTDMLIILTMID